MFKDKQEELERLEAQLLQEDVEEDLPDGEQEEAEEVPPVIYHNYSNDYGRRIYNTDTADMDLEEYSDEVYEPRKRSDVLVLSAIALALVGAILGVLAWWVARYL